MRGGSVSDRSNYEWDEEWHLWWEEAQEESLLIIPFPPPVDGSIYAYYS
jgi:hypothetical protein